MCKQVHMDCILCTQEHKETQAVKSTKRKSTIHKKHASGHMSKGMPGGGARRSSSKRRLCADVCADDPVAHSRLFRQPQIVRRRCTEGTGKKLSRQHATIRRRPDRAKRRQSRVPASKSAHALDSRGPCRAADWQGGGSLSCMSGRRGGERRRRS